MPMVSQSVGAAVGPEALRLPLRAAGVALLATLGLFLANYLANHAVDLRRAPYGYFAVVILAVGTLLPAMVLRWWRLAGWAPSSFVGGKREAVAIGGALVAGIGLMAVALGGVLADEPARAAHLFVSLFAASLAETLVFLGLVFISVEGLLMRSIPRWAAVLVAMLVASVAFGLYHFTYPDPWNTSQQAVRLTVVWLVVSIAFAISRSLWAAALVNNCLATVGFMLNRITTLDAQPLATGLALNAVSVVVVLLVLRSSAREQGRDQGV